MKRINHNSLEGVEPIYNFTLFSDWVVALLFFRHWQLVFESSQSPSPAWAMQCIFLVQLISSRVCDLVSGIYSQILQCLVVASSLIWAPRRNPTYQSGCCHQPSTHLRRRTLLTHWKMKEWLHFLNSLSHFSLSWLWKGFELTRLRFFN